MTTVDEVIAVAQQLPPSEQLEIIQALSRTLQQQYIKVVVPASNTTTHQRVLGLHEGQLWLSDDFDTELSDEFWFGNDDASPA